MATMTRKEIISRNYLLLINTLSEYIDASLFPSIEDLDITNVIYLFNFFFPKDRDEQENRNTIKHLLDQKGIILSDHHLPLVYNLIIDFINFLNNI